MPAIARIVAVMLSVAVIGLGRLEVEAGETGDPFAGLEAVAESRLAELNGREGIVVQHSEQHFTIESGNSITTHELQSGQIGLNDSFHGFRGFNNITANTGPNANVQGGLSVILNLH
jgi:hypothetical protein